MIFKNKLGRFSAYGNIFSMIKLLLLTELPENQHTPANIRPRIKVLLVTNALSYCQEQWGQISFKTSMYSVHAKH
jgi:hypothetical protein